MAHTQLFTPVVQIAHEIRIELAMLLGTLHAGSHRHRPRGPIPPLPEQRVDDEQIVRLRKAEAFLETVRAGAVRR